MYSITLVIIVTYVPPIIQAASAVLSGGFVGSGDVLERFMDDRSPGERTTTTYNYNIPSGFN